MNKQILRTNEFRQVPYPTFTQFLRRGFLPYPAAAGCAARELWANLALQYYTKQLKFAQHPDGKAQLQQARKRLFASYDDALDLEKYGHPHLQEPALAQIVAEEIRRHDGTDYDLLAYSILPNHLHLLLDLRHKLEEEPGFDDLECLLHKSLRNIVQKIQAATESPLKKALRILGTPLDSSTFQKQRTNGNVPKADKIWHQRSFDFQVHDAAGFEKIMHFLLQNPVKAELVSNWKDWPFSYCKGCL